MNEKLKNSLNTAWTEPRHFFLWLALLSLFGFGLILALTAFAAPTLPGATVAVGCLVCFLLSLLAFVLAWIPPLRRLLTALLRRRFLVLGCLVTLVALFYAFEDWRGRRAWLEYRRAAQAKGERLDLLSLAPAPMPAEQNFFETPLWSGMHFMESNGVTLWSDTNWGSRVFFDIYGPNSEKAPSTGNWVKAQPVDLGTWQTYYRGTNNLFAVPGGTPTNYFPVAAAPQSPAADVLLALSRFETNRQLLAASAARPQARFWINYEAGVGSLLPHLSKLKGCAQYLALHANAALAAGQTETALQDVRLLFRLVEAVRGEPILISHLVRIAVAQIAVQPIWQGLASRQWSDADLVALQQELGRLDFLADYGLAMRGERACHFWALDYARKMGPAALDDLFGSKPEDKDTGDLGKFLAEALFRLIPGGWFDQAKVTVAHWTERYMLPTVDPERRLVAPDMVQRSETDVLNASFVSAGFWPMNNLAKMLMPALGRAAERFARGQTSVDQARIACALERYRLAHGQFPENLAALTPQFLPQLPHDLINGQPLQYHRTTDGLFVLYSVGWNQTDDGGKLSLTKSGSPEMDKGDWVWSYRAQ